MNSHTVTVVKALLKSNLNGLVSSLSPPVFCLDWKKPPKRACWHLLRGGGTHKLYGVSVGGSSWVAPPMSLCPGHNCWDGHSTPGSSGTQLLTVPQRISINYCPSKCNSEKNWSD